MAILTSNQTKLWRMMVKHMDHFVHQLHILAVITILIDEIRKDLLDGKIIKIQNFGTFKLKQTNSRTFKSVVTNNIETSQQKNKLELKLTPKLARFISENIDKELKHEYNSSDNGE